MRTYSVYIYIMRKNNCIRIYLNRGDINSYHTILENHIENMPSTYSIGDDVTISKFKNFELDTVAIQYFY